MKILSFVVALLLTSPSWAQDWQSLTKGDAVIRFTGDEDFVTKREWNRLHNRDQEQAHFQGGRMRLVLGHPGTILLSHVSIKERVLTWFNGGKQVKAHGLSAGKSDVRTSENKFGKFYWIGRSGPKGSCLLIQQAFGDLGTAVSEGNRRIYTGACWDMELGNLAELEKFMLGLMQRLQIKLS